MHGPININLPNNTSKWQMGFNSAFKGLISDQWPILFNYLLTPWSRVLLEKLTGLQLLKKFPVFYGNRRFITALTSARHLSLSWASSIQSTHPHSTSRRSILILSSHLHLGLPIGLFPSGLPTKTLYTPLPSPHTRYMPRPSHSSWFYYPQHIGWGVQIIQLLIMSGESIFLKVPKTISALKDSAIGEPIRQSQHKTFTCSNETGWLGINLLMRLRIANGACLDWETSCRLSQVIYWEGVRAIGVLVENCVTGCVMESMCGRFQLSDPRKARLICGRRATTLPLQHPCRVWGQKECTCGYGERLAPRVNKALCVLTANYTLSNNVKIKIDHVNHYFLAWSNVYKSHKPSSDKMR
jgi:hypothetical protein